MKEFIQLFFVFVGTMILSLSVIVPIAYVFEYVNNSIESDILCIGAFVLLTAFAATVIIKVLELIFNWIESL